MSLQRGAASTFPARYKSFCYACDEQIHVGDPILYSNGTRHVTCPMDVEEKPTKFVGSTDDEMGS